MRFEETVFNAGLGASRELRGKPNTVTVSNGVGALISVTKSSWEALSVAGLPDSPLTRKAATARIAHGVERVWQVRPLSQQIHTYSAPTRVAILGSGDELVDEALLPGFRLPLADLFRRTPT